MKRAQRRIAVNVPFNRQPLDYAGLVKKILSAIEQYRPQKDRLIGGKGLNGLSTITF